MSELNHTEEEFRNIVFSDHEDYEVVESPSVFDTGRWTTSYECVVKRLSDNTYWSIWWDVGATEYQEVDPNFASHQVEPVEVTKIEYRRVGKSL